MPYTKESDKMYTDWLQGINGVLKSIYSKITYKQVRLSDYKFSREAISVYYPDKWFGKNYYSDDFISVKPENCSLLAEMIALYRNLPQELFAYNALRLQDFHVSDMAFQTIIEWCKKNGYPYPNEMLKDINKSSNVFEHRNIKSYQEANKKTNKGRLFPFKRGSAFPIQTFLFNLNEIFSLCLIFQFLTESEVDIDSWKSHITFPVYVPLTQKGEESRSELIEVNSILNSENKTKCLEIMNARLSNLKLVFKLTQEKTRLEIEVQDLFDVAFCELVSLLKYGGVTIKECPSCHLLFVTRNKKKIYCPYTRKTTTGKKVRTCTAKKASSEKRKHS